MVFKFKKSPITKFRATPPYFHRNGPLIGEANGRGLFKPSCVINPEKYLPVESSGTLASASLCVDWWSLLL